MAKQSYLKKNEDTAVKFTKAIYKAQQWVENHSAKDITDAIKDEFDDTDPDVIETSIERYKNSIHIHQTLCLTKRMGASPNHYG